MQTNQRSSFLSRLRTLCLVSMMNSPSMMVGVAATVTVGSSCLLPSVAQANPGVADPVLVAEFQTLMTQSGAGLNVQMSYVQASVVKYVATAVQNGMTVAQAMKNVEASLQASIVGMGIRQAKAFEFAARFMIQPAVKALQAQYNSALGQAAKNALLDIGKLNPFSIIRFGAGLGPGFGSSRLNGPSSTTSGI